MKRKYVVLLKIK